LPGHVLNCYFCLNQYLLKRAAIFWNRSRQFSCTKSEFVRLAELSVSTAHMNIC